MESTRYFAPVYLAAIVYRDLLNKENALWYLPSAEKYATVLEHVGLAYSRPRYDTGSHFFIP